MGLGAAALLALLGVLEWRARRHFRRKERMPQGLFSSHPRLGYVLTPGFCGRSSLGIEYRINSAGLRDRERLAGADGPPTRVVAVGNSYAMGAGEPFDQTFLALLETELTALAGPLEVVKAGIGGYGTRHELVFYQEFCRHYEAEVVLLVFAVATDFRNNLAPTRGEVRDGNLVPAYRQSWLRVALERHSALYVGLMRHCRQGRAGRWLARAGLVKAAYPQQVAMLRREYEDSQQRALDQTMEALRGFVRLCREDGTQLLVCLVPDRLQVEEQYRRAFVQAVGLSPDQIEVDKPNRLVGEFCAGEGIACLDLLPCFRRLASQGTDPYRRGDIHWNLAGRAAAATAAAAAIAPLLAPCAAVHREGRVQP